MNKLNTDTTTDTTLSTKNVPISTGVKGGYISPARQTPSDKRRARREARDRDDD